MQKLTGSGLNGVSERDFGKTNLPSSMFIKVLYLRGENWQNARLYKRRGPFKTPLNWTGSVFHSCVFRSVIFLQRMVDRCILNDFLAFQRFGVVSFCRGATLRNACRPSFRKVVLNLERFAARLPRTIRAFVSESDLHPPRPLRDHYTNNLLKIILYNGQDLIT